MSTDTSELVERIFAAYPHGLMKIFYASEAKIWRATLEVDDDGGFAGNGQTLHAAIADLMAKLRALATKQAEEALVVAARLNAKGGAT